MSRNLTAALATAFDSGSVKPIVFAFFDFPGGAVRFWSGSGDKVLTGYSDANLNGTYTGLGDLGALQLPEESSDGSASGAVFTLSGLESTSTSLALDQNYQNSPCFVWIGALDSSDQVIADPYLQMSGLMDVMEMTDDGSTASISIRAEGFAYGVGPSNRRYTDEDQKREFPGDLGFGFVAGLADRQIYWGLYAPEGKPNWLLDDEDEYSDDSYDDEG